MIYGHKSGIVIDITFEFCTAGKKFCSFEQSGVFLKMRVGQCDYSDSCSKDLGDFFYECELILIVYHTVDFSFLRFINEDVG